MPLKNHAPDFFQSSLLSAQILHSQAVSLAAVSGWWGAVPGARVAQWTPHLVHTALWQSAHRRLRALVKKLKVSPQRMQLLTPSPAALFLMFWRRSTRRSSRVFSAFSICSARCITSTIIWCSEEVSGSGCFHWLMVAVFTDQPECSFALSASCLSLGHIQASEDILAE